MARPQGMTTTTTVLVTGAGGTLGSVTVPRLIENGYGVRPMSRSARPGWVAADLRTGEGLDRAMRGVDAVVHLATAPRRARQTDILGTHRLVAAAREAGVRHLLYVSITGTDRVPLAYFRAKLAAEQLVRGGGVPHTILRAAQFHPYVEGLLRNSARLGPLIIDPRFLAQPVDVADVADRIAGLLAESPVGRTTEFAGPQVMTFDEAAISWLAARGDRGRIVRLRLPGRAARAFRDGGLVTGETPRGTRTWQDYLRAED